ncbi:polysaccharide biosynthesis protein, partial [Klebsiella pneumoniae 440_1540]
GWQHYFGIGSNAERYKKFLLVHQCNYFISLTINMNLKSKTIHAVKWNLLSTVCVTGLGMVSLWILSSLFTTTDYGIISAALILSTVFSIITDFGISNSVIRSEKLNKYELSSLYIINVFLGMIFCLGLFIFSAQLASLFNGGTELAKQIKIMSFSLIISSFGGQPRALLARELRFDVISKITIQSAIFNFVFAVFLSYVYRSPWCVAVSLLVSSSISSVLYIYSSKGLRDIKLQFFTLKEIKKHVSYGSQLVMDSIINQISVNTYPVLMARLISLTAIGGYNISYNISVALFEKLNPVLSHALFPAFSKIQNDAVSLKKTFLKVTMFSSLVNFPMLLGMMLISDYVVTVFFEQKWQFITPIVQILCLVGAARSLDVPVISVLLAKGQMYRNVYLGVFKLALGIPLTWFLGKQYGLTGIVFSFLCIQIVNFVMGYFFQVRPCLNIKVKSYIYAVFVPLIHTLPMLVTGYLLILFLTITSPILSMVVIIFSCMSVYIASILTSPVKEIKEFNAIVLNNILRNR